MSAFKLKVMRLDDARDLEGNEPIQAVFDAGDDRNEGRKYAEEFLKKRGFQYEVCLYDVWKAWNVIEGRTVWLEVRLEEEINLGSTFAAMN